MYLYPNGACVFFTPNGGGSDVSQCFADAGSETSATLKALAVSGLCGVSLDESVHTDGVSD